MSMLIDGIINSKLELMNEVQLMIVSFLFILSIWFLILILGAIRQEKRFKRMEENLERFKKSQEEERLTNKKVE